MENTADKTIITVVGKDTVGGERDLPVRAGKAVGHPTRKN